MNVFLVNLYKWDLLSIRDKVLKKKEAHHQMECNGVGCFCILYCTCSRRSVICVRFVCGTFICAVQQIHANCLFLFFCWIAFMWVFFLVVMA